MRLLVYSPFPAKTSNRKLFILFCSDHSKDARGWNIVRQVEKVEEKKSKTIATTNWNDDDDDDDWGEEWEVSEQLNVCIIQNGTKILFLLENGAGRKGVEFDCQNGGPWILHKCHRPRGSY